MGHVGCRHSLRAAKDIFRVLQFEGTCHKAAQLRREWRDLVRDVAGDGQDTATLEILLPLLHEIRERVVYFFESNRETHRIQALETQDELRHYVVLSAGPSLYRKSERQQLSLSQ
jgi:hypothetical protein